MPEEFFFTLLSIFPQKLIPHNWIRISIPPIRIHPVNPLETLCLCTEVLRTLVVLLATLMYEF